MPKLFWEYEEKVVQPGEIPTIICRACLNYEGGRLEQSYERVKVLQNIATNQYLARHPYLRPMNAGRNGPDNGAFQRPVNIPLERNSSPETPSPSRYLQQSMSTRSEPVRIRPITRPGPSCSKFQKCTDPVRVPRKISRGTCTNTTVRPTPQMPNLEPAEPINLSTDSNQSETLPPMPTLTPVERPRMENLAALLNNERREGPSASLGRPPRSPDSNTEIDKN